MIGVEKLYIIDEIIYEIYHILNCRCESNSYDPRSYEHNCIQMPEKFRTSMGFEPLLYAIAKIAFLTARIIAYWKTIIIIIITIIVKVENNKLETNHW